MEQSSLDLDDQMQDQQSEGYHIVEQFEIERGINQVRENHSSQEWTKFLMNRNYWAILMIIIASLLYQAMLEECPYQTDSKCTQEFLLPKISNLLIEGLSSSFLFSFIPFLAYYKIISKKVFFFEVIALGYQMLLQGHTLSTRNFQLVYQIFMLVFILLHCIIILSLILGYRFVKRFRGYTLVFLFLIYVITTLSYIKLTENSCQKWKTGINQDISDDQAYCKIQEPDVCWFDILDGLSDASKLSDCTLNLKQTNPDWIKKWKQYVNITDSTKYLEMPLSTEFDEQTKFKSYEEYQLFYLTQIIPRDSLSDLSQLSESYIDLDTMRYVTKIHRNESLIQEREILYDSNHTKPKNIIIIWIDALARTRFMKKLPKSMKWFKDQSEDRILFEGLRYLSVGTHTSPVYLGYEYGEVINSESNAHLSYSLTQSMHSSGQTYLKSISDQIQESGYIIGRSRTLCSSSITEYESKYQDILNFQRSDHESVGPSCDPNYQNPENPFNLFQGPYSILRKCLYNQEVNQYAFDYAKDFLTAYSDQPKYLELYFLDGHEGTGEAIQYFDEPLLAFLQWLQVNNHLDDSVLSVQSDHGLHMQGLYYILGIQMYHTELALPGVFMLVDKTLLNQTQQTQLIENQQKLVTISEISYFIKYLIKPTQYKEDNSLISTKIPQQRSCTQTAKPSDEFCPCI